MSVYYLTQVAIDGKANKEIYRKSDHFYCIWTHLRSFLMHRNLHYLSLLLFFSLSACVEPFEPEVGEYESALVIDGLFSDSELPSKVTISRSFGYDEEVPVFVASAVVIIEDDQGGSTTLEEKAQGVYETNPAEFRGEVGRSYRLIVRTGGETFESDWELMKPAPPIEDVYFEIEERIPDNSEANPIPGAQIYLNTSDPEGNTRFYRWEWVETFIYNLIHSPIIEASFNAPDEGEVTLIPSDELEGTTCWKTVESKRIITASTENLTEDAIKDLPLHFVDNRSSRLYLKYSLLIKQYAISEAYFDFLKKIEEINQTTGSLFDPIPNEVFGNIKPAEDKPIPVLGYFGVAGVSEKRIFIVREDLPLGFGAPFGPSCAQDTVDLGDFLSLYNRTEIGGRILHNYLLSLFGSPIGYLLTDELCAFCAANEATNVKPDFW